MCFLGPRSNATPALHQLTYHEYCGMHEANAFPLLFWSVFPGKAHGGGCLAVTRKNELLSDLHLFTFFNYVYTTLYIPYFDHHMWSIILHLL